MGQGPSGELQVVLFGEVGATRADRRVPVGGAKARAVLAMLALEAGEVVSAARLRSGLWGEETPPSADGTLRAYVSRLRAAMGGVIERRGAGYRLAIPPDAVDVLRFRYGAEVAARRAAAGDLVGASESLGEALDEWRGDPVADLLDVPFAGAVAASLEVERLRATEVWADLRLELGEHDTLIPWLRRHVSEQPANERLTTQLMLALYRAGHQAQALSAYATLREALASELGIDPGPGTRSLHARILQQDPSLDLPVRVRLPSSDGNLRAPTNAFVGRHDERSRVRRLLGRWRTVTLVGPPGVGKSRLALEVARTTNPSDGAWHVDLSGVDRSEAVATIVAETLQIGDDPSVPTARAIVSAVTGRDLLLVLDDAEQVAEACAELAGLLAPHVPVLVTSRRPLGVSGESLVPVGPLEVGTAAGGADPSDAAQLFVSRAGAISSGDSDGEGDLVERIVRAVGGVPLAIESAAARAPRMPLTELAEALEGRDDTTLSWTIDALGPDEQRCLSRLSVFRGSFGMSAATAVCAGDVSQQLASLVRHAIVVGEPPVDGDSRFRLLDSVRDHAASTLRTDDEAPAAVDRHASVYLELAERGEIGLRGPDMTSCLARLDREQPNIRTAIDRSLTDRPAVARRLAAALGWYWFRRGRIHEGRTVVAAVLDAPGPMPPVLRARVHLSTIGLAYLAGDLSGMRDHLELALEAARRGGHGPVLARCVLYHSWAAALTGDIDAAWGAAREGHDLAREATATDIEAEAAMTFGMLARAAGDLAGAAGHLGAARRLAGSCHHDWAEASATWIAGKVALQRGDLGEAARLQRQNLRRAVSDVDPTGGLLTLHTVAATAVATGRPSDGAELVGAVEALGARLGYHPRRMDPFDAPLVEAMVRDALDADAYAAAHGRGRGLRWDDAVALAEDVLAPGERGG